MGKLLGAAALLLVLAGCGTNPNTAACEGFINRADNYLASTRDHFNAGDEKTAMALMDGMPAALSEYTSKAQGDVSKAMDDFVGSVGLFNAGGTPDLRGSLDRVREVCRR